MKGTHNMFSRFLVVSTLCLALSNCAGTQSQKSDKPQAKNTFLVETDASSVLLQVDLQNKSLVLQKTEDGSCQQWKIHLPQEIYEQNPFVFSSTLTLRRDKFSLVVIPYNYQNSKGTSCTEIPTNLLKEHDMVGGPVVR